MVIGKVLTNFRNVKISTADGKEYSLKMTPLNKLGIRILGIPHIGFRNRARIIFNLLKKASGKSILDAGKGKSILDAGAGYGIYSFMLAEKGYSVSSLDYNPARIHEIELRKEEYPEAGNKIEIKVGSLTNLPYNKNKFDIIICSEVIEHIKQDEKAFSELARVLKPEGKIILSVPTDSKSNRKQYLRFEHERPGYSLENLNNLAEKNRLKIEKVAFYERFFGNIAFNIHNHFKNRAIVALLFYPLYALSFLDDIFKLGEPNGIVVLMKKN